MRPLYVTVIVKERERDEGSELTKQSSKEKKMLLLMAKNVKLNG